MEFQARPFAVLKIVLRRIAAVVFSLVLIELLLQFATHNPNYYFSNRYLFVTAGYARNVSDEFWIYSPNRKVREVVVYGFSEKRYLPGDGYRIEYQCTFSTNNLGLIQERDFFKGDKAVLIVGDSITAGHGGCPWFSRLVSRKSDLELMNGGLVGTGFVHWKHLVEYIQSQEIDIEKIVVIAITNDFKRGPWVWSEKQLKCIDDGRCNGDEYWAPIAFDEPDAAIVARAIQRARKRLGKISSKRAIWDWTKRNVRTINLVARAWLSFNSQPVQSKPHEQTVQSLHALKSLGVPIDAILVPQKNEIGIFPRGPDAELAESLLGQADIPFRWCELEPWHFMPIDSHPNRRGYDQLIDCISSLLDARSGES